MKELLNEKACAACGRNIHEVGVIRGETQCVSLPVPGHTRPGYTRVTDARGQEVLVRVSREKSPRIREILTTHWITIGGGSATPLRGETHDGEFPPGALRPLIDAAD